MSLYNFNYVSTTSNGGNANGDSSRGSVSADGTKLLFQSEASNFVGGDSNGSSDLFVKDLGTGVVTRVSTAANGGQANGDSFSAQFTPDAGKVLFTSDATNLVGGGTAGRGIYLKDLGTGAVQRVVSNVASEGVLSADGTKVAFISNAGNLVSGDTNGKPDLFIKDLTSGTVTRASVAADGTQADGATTSISSLSADGTKVVFRTEATNLGGDPDTSYGWFVKDLTSGAVTPLAVPPLPEDTSGSSAERTVKIVSPNLSPDGTKVAFVEIIYSRIPFGADDFESFYDASTYIQDLTTGQLKTIPGGGFENLAFEAAAKFSPDGNSLVFPKYIRPDGIDSFPDMWIADLTVDGVESRAGFDSPLDYQIAPDGSRIIFTAGGDSPVTTDQNGFDDIYFTPISFGGPSVIAVNATGRGIDDGSGIVTVGQTVTLTLTLSQSVTVTKGSALALTLNSGGRATFDAAASTSQNLVFTYRVRPDEVTSDLRPAGIERNGATIRDAAGREADLSEALQPIPGTLKVNGYVGTNGNETFNGTSGGETFVGSGGNDLYLVNNAGDRVVEFVGEGKDAIVSTLSYTLQTGQEIETLQLGSATGKANLNLTGNEFGQTLRGNSGNNILDGRGGVDTLIGGAGNDVYGVDDARDVVIEAAGGGRDAIVTSVSYALGAGQEIEQVQVASSATTAKLNITANSFDNTLVGGRGVNWLDGGAGDDVLAGKLGNDVLMGRAGRDTFVFDTQPGNGNVDRITDFSHADDTIRLAKSVFSALAPGELAASAFKDAGNAGAVIDADDRVIYDHRSGALYYDTNGNGAGGRTLVATLDNKAILDHSDFLVV